MLDRTFRSLLAASGLLICLSGAAMAQDSLRIVAVVNDDAITQLDVAVRLRMAILSAGLQPSEETAERLKGVVLRGMIDEKLMAQEARRWEVEIDPADVQQGIAGIAERNGVALGEFIDQLEQAGVSVDILAEKIRTEMAWARLVQRNLSSDVQIADADIDAELARIQASQGQTEYRVAQIFLPVGGDDDAAQRESAQRLKDQLDQGADFVAIASQFSQDQGAARGGDLGWVPLESLDPEVGALVRSLSVGAIGGPVRGAGGFYIVQVKNTRPMGLANLASGSVEMRQILWQMPANAADSEIDKARQQAESLIPRIRSCADMEIVAADAAPAIYRASGRVDVADLPPEVQQVALNQPIGAPSRPVRTERGISILIVCARSAGEEDSLSRVGIAERLGRERLETLARGYLSDLRRAAVIDIRQ
jgi:peptidyl-prolyl cis-trans isomerase SurA